jgi:hypothetical protein
MFLKKILPLFFVVAAITGSLAAQIYAPAANDSFAAKYNHPGTDKVFVFNRPQYKGVIAASIIAVSIDRLSGWSFQWSVFDPGTWTYNAVGFQKSIRLLYRQVIR